MFHRRHFFPSSASSVIYRISYILFFSSVWRWTNISVYYYYYYVCSCFCPPPVSRGEVSGDEWEHEPARALVVHRSDGHLVSHRRLADETSQELLWSEETCLEYMSRIYMYLTKTITTTTYRFRLRSHRHVYKGGGEGGCKNSSVTFKCHKSIGYQWLGIVCIPDLWLSVYLIYL